MVRLECHYKEFKSEVEFDAKKTALMIIDMQRAFLYKGITAPGSEVIIPRIKLVAEKCREKKIPVIYSRFNIPVLYISQLLGLAFGVRV